MVDRKRLRPRARSLAGLLRVAGDVLILRRVRATSRVAGFSGQASSSGSLLGDRVEPAADLVHVGAEVVEARELREALQPEDPLEERCRAVPDRTAGRLVAAGLGDQAA